MDCNQLVMNCLIVILSLEYSEKEKLQAQKSEHAVQIILTHFDKSC